jgi:hypothetical protein
VRRLLLPLVFTLSLASAAQAALIVRIPGIRSPSGNIQCLFVPGAHQATGGRGPSTLLCTIAHASYTKTLQARCLAPGGAGVDWHGFTLGATQKGSVSCSGGILYNPDTQRPAYTTLPYGKTWHHGVFTCSSRVTGITCRNREGHGLFISREAWRAW